MLKPGLPLLALLLLGCAGTPSPSPSPSPTPSPWPSPACSVVTLAGSAGSAAAYADGTGSAARFASPFQLALSPTAGLLIADRANNRVRALNLTSLAVSTYFFTGASGGTDGTAGVARASAFPGIALDASGRLFVGDTGSNRLRVVDACASAVGTVAGSGAGGGTDGPALSATVNPSAVALGGGDPAGTLYFTDWGGHRLRAVAGGSVSTVSGSGAAGWVDGPGASARFNRPHGLAVEPTASAAYVADSTNNRIRMVLLPSAVTSTLAGSGSAAFADGSGTAASLNAPIGLSLLGLKLYIADSGNNRVRVLRLDTLAVTTLAGSGSAGSANGQCASASFSAPQGVAIAPDGLTLYVSDTNANAIRAVTVTGLPVVPSPSPSPPPSPSPLFRTPGTWQVSTLAGCPGPQQQRACPWPASLTAGAFGADFAAAGVRAYFNQPWGLDALNGTVYVVERWGASRLRAINASTGAVAVLAGSYVAGFANGLGGSGGPATFNSPVATAVNPRSGVVYVADVANSAVRAVAPGGSAVTTLAGSGVSGGANGIGAGATFQSPAGLAVSPDGATLWVSEWAGQRIRAVPTSGSASTSTLAGSGVLGWGDAGGTASLFSYPGNAVWCAARGLLVVVEGNPGGRVRSVNVASGSTGTLAGSTSGVGGSVNGVGTAALLGTLGGVACDGVGVVYITDQSNNQLRVIAPGSEHTGRGGGSLAQRGGRGSQRHLCWALWPCSGCQQWGAVRVRDSERAGEGASVHASEPQQHAHAQRQWDCEWHSERHSEQQQNCQRHAQPHAHALGLPLPGGLALPYAHPHCLPWLRCHCHCRRCLWHQ